MNYGYISYIPYNYKVTSLSRGPHLMNLENILSPAWQLHQVGIPLRNWLLNTLDGYGISQAFPSYIFQYVLEMHIQLPEQI